MGKINPKAEFRDEVLAEIACVDMYQDLHIIEEALFDMRHDSDFVAGFSPKFRALITYIHDFRQDNHYDEN